MASNKLTELIGKIKDFKETINQQIQQIVIDNEHILCDMNATEQLRDKGVNAVGVAISDYAPYADITVQVKKAKGQPYDRVTLQDTGEFHASFYVDTRSDEFEIKANDWKASELERKYGKEIFGLTDENISEFGKEYVYPELLNNLINMVNGN